MSGEITRGEAPWPSYALPRATTVNGYRIERVLGSGGFGITYLAHDLLGQRFAIKEYYPRQFATRRDLSVLAASPEDEPLFEECRERFLREAQALVLLGRAAGTSDGIVRVQTYFEAHGTGFLVMDYIEGTTLASILRQQPGGLPAARVRSLLSQLLSSIRIVHRAGLMHRDIKPANIIVRDDDRAVLIDFGSTGQAARSENTAYTQIYSGGYAPPEQVLGLHQGAFSDIYAIGAVCYRAIGGTVVDALARKNAVATGRPDPQPAANQIGSGRYPGALLTAIDAALAIDAMQRPQNVDAMLDALHQDAPDGEPTIAAARRGIPVVGPWRSGVGTWLAAGAAVAVLALAGTGYLVLRSPNAPQQAVQQQVIASAPILPAPPPPAPTTLASEQPEPAPPIPATLSPPQEPQQREAIVVPLPAPEPPAPPPPAFPSTLERAQTAAGSLPCSALNVTGGPTGMRISGLASAGPEVERLLAELRGAGRVTDEITRIDRFACAPISAVGALIRQARDVTPPQLAIRLDPPVVLSGARVGISVATRLPALYVDLYQADGSVRHLLRPTSGSIANKLRTDWPATPPPGPRLIVALGAATPVDLAIRPEIERTADYLAALQSALQHASAQPFADLAVVTVRAAEPAVSKVPQPRPTSLRSDKCANIVSRAQLGETLSDAELAALRTECRS